MMAIRISVLVGYLLIPLPLLAEVTSEDAFGPYCGIYSASRALGLIGMDVSPADFATVKYVAAQQGSTPENLIEMCTTQGANAVGLKNLSKVELLAFGLPVIANVRRSAIATEFDHWVCVVASGSKLYVYDNASEAELVDYGEFAALWNGYGIVVSRDRYLSIKVVALRLTMMILIGLCVYLVSSAVRSKSETINWVTRVGILSFAISIFFGDIQAHVRASRLSAAAFLSSPIVSVNLAALDSGELGDRVLIDARYASDFRKGAIPKALNVPVSFNDQELSEAVSGVGKDRTIIVYCQSRKCPYDEQIARRLQLIGYVDVRTLEVGWVEYHERETTGL